MDSQKSLCITYILWFFFGWMGVHHLYLNRDRQAFIWWSTFGGYNGLGWIRDFWRIPEYVDDANEEAEYMDTLARRIKLYKKPRFSVSRFLGELLIGYYYGNLVRSGIPEEVPMFITGLFVCVGVTAGVYLVGNIGREEGPFLISLLAAIGCYILFSILSGSEASYMYTALATSGAFNYYREYRRRSISRKFSERVLYLAGGAAVVWVLWISFFYFNASITIDDGEKIKLRDSVNHFFKSPAWVNFSNTWWSIYEEGQKKGWKSMYDEIIKSTDPKGEANAYYVLGLKSDSSEEQIRRAYKKLVVKWHPDKHKGEAKQQAKFKFMEIQQAYEILSRRKKASYSRDTEERSEF